MSWFKRKVGNSPDEALLERARDGDRAALGELFNRYVELLFGVARKYYQDHGTAEDVVMEIFEKYQVKIKTQEIGNFRPWLYVLAKNHCLERLRKEKRISEKKDAYTFMQSEPIEHPVTEDLKEDQLVALENCLETLKTEQKQTVQLFYLEQRSYKEISEKLTMPWEKVRSHIQNGRRNLKKCIEGKL